MKHIILGEGNLGWSLLKSLQWDQAGMFGTDWRWPRDGLKKVAALAPEYVWCCVGGGSVEWAKMNPGKANESLYELPEALWCSLPNTRIILFSSDYCANEADPEDPDRHVALPRSFYAELKLKMERKVRDLGLDRIRVVRVGSLYGDRRPKSNFANRIRYKYPEPCDLKLPANQMCPTPTEWVATILSQGYRQLFDDDRPVHHLAPYGSAPVYRFAQKVLGSDYDIRSSGYDRARPNLSCLGTSFVYLTDTWDTLWQRYDTWNTNTNSP